MLGESRMVNILLHEVTQEIIVSRCYGRRRRKSLEILETNPAELHIAPIDFPKPLVEEGFFKFQPPFSRTEFP